MEATEVDHADYVGNADLFVFSKDLFCPFGSRKDGEFSSLMMSKSGTLAPGRRDVFR